MPRVHGWRAYQNTRGSSMAQIINRQGLPGHVKSELCTQVNGAVLGTTRLVIEGALEEEVAAYWGAERYAHLPCGRGPEQTRSGYYQRELITPYGRIADLRVPKLLVITDSVEPVPRRSWSRHSQIFQPVVSITWAIEPFGWTCLSTILFYGLRRRGTEVPKQGQRPHAVLGRVGQTVEILGKLKLAVTP